MVSVSDSNKVPDLVSTDGIMNILGHPEFCIINMISGVVSHQQLGCVQCINVLYKVNKFLLTLYNFIFI